MSPYTSGPGHGRSKRSGADREEIILIFMFRIVVPDMKLSPNVGSDRSWVWNAAADVSEGEPEAQTLAIRLANSESKSPSTLYTVPRSFTCRVRITGG